MQQGGKKEEGVAEGLIYIETCMYVFVLVRPGRVESACAVTEFQGRTCSFVLM